MFFCFGFVVVNVVVVFCLVVLASFSLPSIQ